jgi:single stranded DNA-binding protein
MNNCKFYGNLVSDPQLVELPNKVLTRFRLCINSNIVTKSNEKKVERNFLDFVVYGSAAEYIANYFKKGDPILVTDALARCETWEKDGKPRSRVVFRVNSFENVNRRNQNNRNNSNSNDNSNINDDNTTSSNHYDDAPDYILE